MVRTGSLQRVGHSEVGHAGVASGEQDILGFDVAVHNAVLVCAIQGFSDFPGDPNCVLDWQLTFPPQPIPQALAFDVRHGVPQALASFTGVEHGQDVRVVEPGREADFPEEPLWAERSAELGMKHLERHRAVVLQVAGEENGGHPAASELTLDGVAAGDGGVEVRDQVHDAVKMGLARVTSTRLSGYSGTSLP